MNRKCLNKSIGLGLLLVALGGCASQPVPPEPRLDFKNHPQVCQQHPELCPPHPQPGGVGHSGSREIEIFKYLEAILFIEEDTNKRLKDIQQRLDKLERK